MKSITDVSHPDNSQYDSEYILRVHVLVWSNPRSSLPENTAERQPRFRRPSPQPKISVKNYMSDKIGGSPHRGTERRLGSLTLDDLRKEDCRLILLTLIAAQRYQEIPEITHRKISSVCA